MIFNNPGDISFETHIEKLTEPARKIMVDLRNFAKSLGSNVIEEVRPHRVVYAKTMNFRIFLDIQPADDALMLTIRYGRASSTANFEVRTMQEAENVKKQITDAYNKIQ